GIRETAEIVMRAHLAAVDRVDLAHRLLDERMAGLALHGLAAGALDEIDRAPREPRIVHDRLAGILLEETHREEPDDVVALDERAFLVEEEAAVEVAVPCETEIRAGLADLLDRHDAVALDHRIRHAVRERAVRRVMELHELERQVRLEQVHDRARAAVAGVHDDLQGLQRLAIDVAQQVLDVRRPDVDRLDRAFALGLAERLALRDRLDVLEAGIGADRPRLLADHLHAVVVRRIVARGDHDAAVELLVESGEVDDLGADDADIEHVDARVGEAARERRREGRARQADIAPDGHPACADELGVSAADAVGDVLVELARDAAADVVGLETGDFLHSPF